MAALRRRAQLLNRSTRRSQSAAVSSTGATSGTHIGWSVLVASTSVFSGVAAGCVPAEVTPPPWCDRSGSIAIVAQSQPSAGLVPCLNDLPSGWSVASVDVNQSGAEITLDSDRAGAAAARLSLLDACDVSEAVRSPSEFPGVARYDDVVQLVPSFVGRRSYVFPDACVRWDFAFDRDVSATESVAVGEALELVRRDELNDAIREEFMDIEL